MARWALKQLLPSARNARTHSPEQVAQLARSIETFGWTMPVLVDEEGVLIAGHGRVMAAQLLGLAEVPVMVAKGWTDEQKRAYALADNQLPLNAGWDTVILRDELKFLDTAGIDLPLLGFNDMDLITFMAGGSTKDPDEVEEPPVRPVSRPGDLWVLGRHRLLCGDSTKASDVKRALDGAEPNLMVTDPPYGVDYDPSWRDGVDLNLGKKLGKRGSGRALGVVENDGRVDWTDAWKLYTGDVAYVWHSALHTSEVEDSLRAAGLVPRAQIIWAKQIQVFGRGDYHWKHEPCWYVVRDGRPGHWAGDRKQTTVWDIQNNNPLGGSGEAKTGHSTQKPIECMRRPIVNNTKPGDVVYDPFVGSGTAIIAAEFTGRACRAIELSPAYVDVALKRWQDHADAKATLAGDGRTFDQVARARKRGGDDAKGDSGKSVQRRKRAAGAVAPVAQ